MVKSNDRRVKYTKYILRESLLELLKVKLIQDITVTELCKKADVNRNTFYTHYLSPVALLQSVEDDFVKTIIKKVEKSRELGYYNQLFYSLCLHLHDNEDLCKVLIIKGERNLLIPIIRYFRKDITAKWGMKGDMDQSKAELLYEFVSGGSVSVLEEWIRSDFKKDADTISKEIKEILVVINNHFINEQIN